MKKLIIQIACFNEEQILPETLRDLPRTMSGFDVVEWLVVDDGSTDRTVDAARKGGADHILSMPRNQGLARAFVAGLHRSLDLGADVIVHTDADNQYRAEYIDHLVDPIRSGRADITIGCRPIRRIEHFSVVKKWLQAVGSWAVSIASGVRVPDATSGFRAYTREAAMTLFVFNRFTYTLETLIQAGRGKFRIESVPVSVNPPTRSSRLFRNNFSYVFRSLIIIARIFIIYKPFRFFLILAAGCLLPALWFGLRFLYAYAAGGGAGHVQSLILTAILSIASVLLLVAGVLADVIAANRVLLEDIRIRMLAQEWANRKRGNLSPSAEASRAAIDGSEGPYSSTKDTEST